MKIRILDIAYETMADGPGLRTSIYCAGCAHHCPGCHNPETWEFGCGTKVTEGQVLAEIVKNPLCRGVTFSGGEPFAQAEGFACLAKLLKEKGYEVASYTGYTFEQLLNGTEDQKLLLGTIDILIDGPFIQSQKSLELVFRGSRNQRILDVPRSLDAGKAVETTSKRWLGEY